MIDWLRASRSSLLIDTLQYRLISPLFDILINHIPIMITLKHKKIINNARVNKNE